MEIPSANKVPSSQSSIVPSAPKVDSLIVEKVVAKTEPKNDENQDKPDVRFN